MCERKLGFFVKVKEDQNFNRRNICNILRIKIFSAAEIDEKDSFRSGTSLCLHPVGTWLSLVEHRVRDAGAAGSNPVVPTITISVS